MSYEKVKSIRFDKTNKQVFVTSSSNNIFPLHFTTWECQGFTRAWQSKGYDEMMKYLLESIVNGDLQFYSGKFREFRSYTSRVDIKKAYPLIYNKTQEVGNHIASKIKELNLTQQNIDQRKKDMNFLNNKCRTDIRQAFDELRSLLNRKEKEIITKTENTLNDNIN